MWTSSSWWCVCSAKELLPGESNVAYICSRYYRAPELILGATDYTIQIGLLPLFILQLSLTVMQNVMSTVALFVGCSRVRCRSSSPSGSGSARLPSAFWRILGLNLHHFEYLMQLTDILSHNIISHKRDTDEPITKAVSKCRIQTLSSLTEQVVLRP